MRRILKALAVAALTAVLLSSTALATMYQGRKEIAATGTAVAIYGSSQVVDWVSLYAPKKNKGPVYAGGSSTTYTGLTTDGRPIVPGAVVVVGPCNLNNVYINGLDNDAVYFVASDESGVDLGAITTLLGTIDTDTGNIATSTATTAENTEFASSPDWSVYLVSGALTSTGVQYSTVVDTTTVNTDVVLLSGTFEPLEMSASPKTIVWVYFNVACEFRAVSTGTADIDWIVQARDEGGTWVTISDTGEVDNPSTSYVASRLEGYAALVTNFDVIPFDWQILFQCNEANEGRGRVTNATMIRCVWDPTS